MTVGADRILDVAVVAGVPTTVTAAILEDTRGNPDAGLGTDVIEVINGEPLEEEA